MFVALVGLPLRSQAMEPRVEVSAFGGVVSVSPNHQLRDIRLVPFGDPQPNPALAPGPEFGLRLGLLATDLVGVELEGGVAPLRYASYPGDVLLFPVRAQVVVQLPRYARLSPVFVAGAGVLIVRGGAYTPGHDLGSDFDGAVHWGIGGKFAFLDSLLARIDLRHTLSPRYDGNGLASHFEALASFTFAPNRRIDADGDGLLDAEDLCPTLAAATASGCPDRDGDGIADPKDACVDVAGVAPDGCPLADADHDGVPDASDACPAVAGTLANGCPDGDHDGVADDRDACPALAGRPSDGCPDQDGDGVVDPQDACPTVAGPLAGCPDQDGDRVRDADDRCPAAPETVNGFEDADGCPDVVPPELQKALGSAKSLTFDTGRPTLSKAGEKALDGLAAALKKQAGVRLGVTAYTDGSGEGGDAVALTQGRAEAVKAGLVKRGVEAARVQASGGGATKPLAAETNDANRAKNRRIELELVP